MEYLQSLSQGKSAQSQTQAGASASPVATKTLNTPEDYLDLVSTDASKLSKDQYELVQIFNNALNRLTMADKSEANAKAIAGPIILQNVSSAQNKEDFDKIRAAADSLKTTATRDLNSLQSFERISPFLYKGPELSLRWMRRWLVLWPTRQMFPIRFRKRIT